MLFFRRVASKLVSRQKQGPVFFTRRLLLPLLSSLLLFSASPGASNTGWLAWTALIPLVLSFHNSSPKQAFLSGFLFGLVYHLLLVNWIIHALSNHGQVPVIFSAIALLALSSYMSLYPAAFGLLYCWLRPRIPLLWLAPLIWVGLDALRGMLFTGFPWLDLAYTQFRFPLLIQISDLTGHHGLTFLIVLVNILLATGTQKIFSRELTSFPGKIVLSAIFTVVLAFSYTCWKYNAMKKEMATAERISTAIVQGNIPQDEKWQTLMRLQSIDTYIRFSERAVSQGKTDLVIWPETAFPHFPMEHPIFQEVVENLTTPYNVSLLSGAPHREKDKNSNEMQYFNSGFLFTPDGRIAGRYDKQHLVPFGEYIPFRKIFSFASPVVETLGDFTPGKSITPLTCQNSRIGVLICFESIFPELARKQVANGATLLANLTNDAWFGRSNAPWQHLSMSVFRAVENRRSLARAANTGFSCFIDPLGNIKGLTQLFETQYVRANLPLITEKTFYVQYGHFFPLTCLLLLLGEIFRKMFFSRRK